MNINVHKNARPQTVLKIKEFFLSSDTPIPMILYHKIPLFICFMGKNMLKNIKTLAI